MPILLRFTGLLAASITFFMSQARALEIIGHRGASHDAPENTLAALKLSFEQGADGTELDIHLTKDGKIAVSHDYDLKRCAGVDLKIADASLAALREFNIGNFGQWKDRGFTEKVPELSDVLAIIPAGKRLFIEIKCKSEILPALAKTFAEAKLDPQQLPIIAFDYEVARAAKEMFPRHEVAWLHGWSKDKENPSVEELINKAREAKLDGLDLNNQFPIDKEFVRKVHAAGLKIYTWTVNNAAVARAESEAGVDGITTDRPGWLRGELSRRP